MRENPDSPLSILFICTHNRCRSILSEAISNQLGEGRLVAYSAGSQPAGQVHPLTIKYLEEKGYSTKGLRSQSWDEFESVKPDIIVTVCDNAANEVCPVWFDKGIKLHWGLPDPSKLEGDEETQRSAFFSVINTIEKRCRQLLSLEINRFDKVELSRKLAQLVSE